MQNKVVVVGSANMDIYVNTKYLPEPGETVICKNYLMTIGGKGANQSVAAQKLGADVAMIGKIGDDSFGKQILETLQQYHVDVCHFLSDPHYGSGMAVIIVDEQPQNVIAVTPGANSHITLEDIRSKKIVIQEADIVLAQLEIPLPVVEAVGDILADSKGLFILNPAPAKPLTKRILQNVDILTPNQTEAKILTGIDAETTKGAKEAGSALLDMGAKAVIITMGKQGAMYLTGQTSEFIPAYTIDDAVDPSGAGDAFMGGLSVGLLKGKSMIEAIRYGNLIGGLSTRKHGAMPAMPDLTDVKNFLGSISNFQEG